MVKRHGGVLVVATVLVVLTVVAARYRDRPSRPPQGPLTSVSPELAAAVVLTDSLLASGGELDDVGREYIRILDLQRRLREARAGDPAHAEFLDFWRQSPGDIRLLETAWLRRQSFQDRAEWESLWSAGTGADSTRATAIFAQARAGWGKRPNAEAAFFAVEALQAQLSFGEAVFLQERLAQVEDRRGDCGAAVLRLFRCLPAVWQTGAQSHAAVVWNSIANYYLHESNLDHALVAADVSSRCAALSGEPEQRVMNTYLGARILADQERHEAAADSFESTLRQAEAQNLSTWSSLAVGRLALLARAQGDNRRSLRYQFRSLDLVKAQQDTLGMIKRLCVIAGTYRELGVLDSARVYLESAANLGRLRPDAASTTVVDRARHLYALQLGDTVAADSLAAVLLSRPDVQADPDLVRDLKLDLLSFGLESGRPDLAYRSLEHLKSGGRITRESTDYDARLWLSLRAAELYARQGEYDLAKAELDTVALLTERVTGAKDRWLVWQTRGEIAELVGDLDSAGGHYREAQNEAANLADPDKVRRSRIRYGEVLLELGRPQEARLLFASSWNAPEYWSRFASALFTGLSFAAEGRHDEALGAYGRADSLLAAGSPGELAGRLQLARARSLSATGRTSEAWQSLRSEGGQTASAATLERSEILRAFYRDIERERAELLLGLLFDHPELAGGRDAITEALQISESVRRSSGPVARAADAAAIGSPAVRFFLGNERGFVWVGTHRGWTMRELPELASLKQMIRDVMADMASPSGEIAWDQARELATTLLGDVAVHWTEGRPLWIAADGILVDFPWSALPLPGSEEQLVDHGQVVDVVAGLGPHRWPDRRDGPPRILVLGVNGGPAADNRLHAAEREAGDIAALFPEEHCTLLVGADAGWDAFRPLARGSFDAIHLATHARLSQGRRGGSTLRLSEGSGSRPVTAEEIRSLELDTDLVYLSCCDGARLAADRASALDSFARAFLHAGARSVVASSQPVDDETSRMLARRFYDHWRLGEDPATALRAAQLAIRAGNDGRDHPFYWAFLRVLVAAS